MTTSYYKSTLEDGSSNYGTGKWHLPQDGQPGAWRIAYGELSFCQNGIHACRREDLIYWLGPRIFVFELLGDELVESGNKVLGRRGRLVSEMNWDEKVVKRYINSSRKHFRLSPVNWLVCRSAAQSALRMAWTSALWAAGPSASQSVWLTNNLFDHLEGRA